MKASIEDQRRLVALQDLDTELAKVAHKRKTLPEHAQLAELVASKDSLDARLVAAQTRLADADLALRRAQEDLVPVRQRMERDQSLIDAGANNDAKALQALLSEVEHLKRRLGNLEDLELEAMEEQEIAAALCEHCATEKAEFMPTVREVKDRREQLMAGCDATVAELSQRRAAAAECVP
ncbi:MAG: zinc ribbon domain-containing protein, partial [Propionibacteriaceae bacterium]